MTYAFDPELLPLLDMLPPGGLDFSNYLAAREAFAQMSALLNTELDASGVDVVNRSIPGPDGAPEVPIRVYTPQNLTGTTAGILHIHGGGFVIGDLDGEMGQCLQLCREVGAVVVSVDYRLAPETPYPGGLEDCYSALQWFQDNAGELSVEPDRIALFGQSAGAGLSAGTAILSRDRQGPSLCFQFLGIPELDDRLDTPSMQAFDDTPMWHRPNAESSWELYLGESYQRGAHDVPASAAPARLEDATGLPPTYISTMEFDPLRDEGVLYALKLMQAGVPTELHSFPGTFHGSSMLGPTQIAVREQTEMIAVLRRALQMT